MKYAMRTLPIIKIESSGDPIKDPVAQIESPGPASPLPWRIHTTGGYIAVLDAANKPVIRKTTNTLTIEQFRMLKANLEFMVAACNGSIELIS